MGLVIDFKKLITKLDQTFLVKSKKSIQLFFTMQRNNNKFFVSKKKKL